MPLNGSQLAVVGAGVMGEAMIKGLLKQELIDPSHIIAADPHKERLEQLRGLYNIRTTTDNLDAVQDADVLVLSVKPQVLGKVLPQLRGRVDRISLVLSIAAGMKIKKVSSQLLNARVVRAMPNTPGQIGAGITVWTASSEVEQPQLEQARMLIGALGEQIFVEDEVYLDMATALSGTGPAYVFLFMEALIDAGVHMGFSRRDAEKLVLQTLLGSVKYAMESGLHPAQLRNQVTSPGGTTAAALYEMEKGGLRTVISDAVWGAYERSQALGRSDE